MRHQHGRDEAAMSFPAERAASAGPSDVWSAFAAIFLVLALSPLTFAHGQAVDDEAEGLAAGDSFRDCPACPEMVVVPAGSFLIGSAPDEVGHASAEAPRHEVTIDAPFAIARHETTIGEWQACIDEGGQCRDVAFSEEGDRLPVTRLAWTLIPAYLDWLNARTGQDYRLPSEAEWEYAARAGSRTAFAFGDHLTADDANFGDHAGAPDEVGSYRPNGFGIHDMHGNAAEWAEDCWHDGYAAPADGSAWVQDCRWRVWRGGSWASEVASLRSAARSTDMEHAAGYDVGFRVVRSIAQ